MGAGLNFDGFTPVQWFWFSAFVAFNVLWISVLLLNIWRGVVAFVKYRDVRQAATRTIICSSAFLFVMYWLKTLFYTLMDYSLILGFSACAIFSIACFRVAVVIDHSRGDRQ